VWDHGGSDAGGDRVDDGEGIEEEIKSFIYKAKAHPYSGWVFFIDGLMCRPLLDPRPNAFYGLIATVTIQIVPVIANIPAIIANIPTIIANVATVMIQISVVPSEPVAGHVIPVVTDILAVVADILAVVSNFLAIAVDIVAVIEPALGLSSYSYQQAGSEEDG
jgi:hypothetical protein